MKRYAVIVVSILVVLTGALPKAPAAVYLKSGTIDTLDQPAATSDGLQGALGSGCYLVALRGPVSDADKISLSLAGAELLSYIPDNAFLARIEHSRRTEVRKLACVEWVGLYRAEHKSDPGAAPGMQGQYVVQVFPGESAERVVRKAGVKRIGQAEGRSCRVLADGPQLAELARSGAVAWIEPYIQPKLCNNVAASIAGVPYVRQSLGLYGAGQLIGIADSGLDTGDLSTLSADFAGRVEKTYTLRRPGEWSDLNGHGTHVVGTAVGSGALSGSNPSTHSYDVSFAGIAPEARLVFQSIGDSGQFVFPPLHLADLFGPAYADGVRVHSNSWGSAAAGNYTVYSNEVDRFIWDHRDFTVVFAVGNESVDRNADGIVDKDSLYAPATAKNAIAVGASENNRTSGGYQMGYGQAWPSDYPAAPIKYDNMSSNPSGMAAFSGRGPTDDGRVKPDICAPGTNIISSRSHACNAGGWQVLNSDYIFWGGTSMSAPQVAGAAALVREYLQEEKGINPSAALVKAALINGATDMAPGQYGTASVMELLPAPDFSQGWGRLNLKQTLFPDLPAVNEFLDSSNGLSTGGYSEYQFEVTSSSAPFVATLVWTDYPGAVQAARELVNDLDLTVITPSGHSYPTITNVDRTNNVEQVRLSAPETGLYTVRVSGYNVPMGPQDYALAVSGPMPAAYISGTITSTSGAGIQGVTVALVSPGSVKRVSTNSNGKYLTHVAPGTYSVQVSKPGWNFTPRAQTAAVGESPVTGVNFTGTGTPGSVSGTVTSVMGGVVSRIVESSHPYLNNFDQTYTITAYEAATRVRVHFAEIDLMSDGDEITVLDANGNVIDTFTGKGEDVWSAWVPGNTVRIRLLTNDYGNIGYGFYIDGYETDLAEQGGVDGVALTLSLEGTSSLSLADGTYTLSSVPPGTYTVTPSKPHWRFQPASRTVDIPSGGAVTGLDFQAMPPGSISGVARVVDSRVHAVDIESPHPYPDNYSETWEIVGDPSVTRMRVHFSELAVEPGWDFIFLMDGQDNIVEIFSEVSSDLWTPWVEGNVVRIMLSSDFGNSDFGFIVDRYEAQSAGIGLEGASVQLSPDGRTVLTGPDGAFEFSQAPVGSHTLVPGSLCYTFDPTSVLLNVSAGVTEYVQFYVIPRQLRDVAPVKSLADGALVDLTGLVVSGVFDGFFYVQDSQGVSGIRVQWSGPVTAGALVEVKGRMTTAAGERVLVASDVR